MQSTILRFLAPFCVEFEGGLPTDTHQSVIQAQQGREKVDACWLLGPEIG